MAHVWSQAGNQLLMVTLVGLLLGAGLPAIFSLGMSALTIGRPHTAGTESVGKATPVGLVLSGICFTVVIGAILFGIAVIIWGKQIFGGH